MTAPTAGPLSPAALLNAVAAGNVRRLDDGRAIWHQPHGDVDVTPGMRLLADLHGAAHAIGGRYELTEFGRHAHEAAHS